jgi:formylglycine-generating enzyme required for sulfatase activity
MDSAQIYLVTAKQSTEQELVAERIDAFERRYGSMAVRLACCAAFPLALTSELVYCMRENILDLQDAPWYMVTDLLLSGLCQSIGYNLYEMPGAVRQQLLQRLKEERGAVRIRELEEFMSNYIATKLELEGKKEREWSRVRLLGDRPHWTALCCLQPGEMRDAIGQEIQRIWESSTERERLHLSAMLESYGEMLPGEPFLVQWAGDIAEGRPIEYGGQWDYAKWAQQYGIKLVTQQVMIGKIRFSDAPEPQPVKPLEFRDPNVLKNFEFTVVTVNEQGIEQSRQQRNSRYFIEPLGDIADPQVPCLEMVEIPGGEFMMGSPDDELGRYDRESPRHLVQVPPFFMSKYQVTQAQWKAISAMDKVDINLELAPSQFIGDNLPVETVSWLQAQEFCERVTKFARRQNGETSWICRLPTEAEWEYACRAGTITPFHFGENISAGFANYAGNSTYGQGEKGEYKEKTSFVGSFGVANNFGLYDMHGNVWEWCLDNWHNNYESAPGDGSAWLNYEKNNGDKHILRGGSWFNHPYGCRSAFRYRVNSDVFNDGMGFRVVYAPASAL